MSHGEQRPLKDRLSTDATNWGRRETSPLIHELEKIYGERRSKERDLQTATGGIKTAEGDPACANCVRVMYRCRKVHAAMQNYRLKA